MECMLFYEPNLASGQILVYEVKFTPFYGEYFLIINFHLLQWNFLAETGSEGP